MAEQSWRGARFLSGVQWMVKADDDVVRERRKRREIMVDERRKLRRGGEYIMFVRYTILRKGLETMMGGELESQSL